jgi:hypothetical protein
MTGGAVFSNSRIGLAGLARSDGRVFHTGNILMLDQSRDFTVPWVSDLSPLQILQLREEASTALPLLREKICKALKVGDDNLSSRNDIDNLMMSLREQAAEVRSELEAKRKNSARFWKVTYGILGLGLSVYGAATNQAVPAVGGLLPIIQLLIGHKVGHDSDIATLTSKPGYVLVKAQDLLAHADS